MSKWHWAGAVVAGIIAATGAWLLLGLVALLVEDHQKTTQLWNWAVQQTQQAQKSTTPAPVVPATP